MFVIFLFVFVEEVECGLGNDVGEFSPGRRLDQERVFGEPGNRVVGRLLLASEFAAKINKMNIQMCLEALKVYFIIVPDRNVLL